MNPPLSPRELRLSSQVRGIIIGALALAFGFLTRQPGASLTYALLIAAGLQVLVILIRRLVPPGVQPMALYVFELLADAATVLLFALGAFGGILRHGMSPEA